MKDLEEEMYCTEVKVPGWDLTLAESIFHKFFFHQLSKYKNKD